MANVYVSEVAVSPAAISANDRLGFNSGGRDGPPTQALTTEPVRQPHIRVSLVSQVDNLQPGVATKVGVDQPRVPFCAKHYNSGNMQALQKKYTGMGVEWLTIISSAEGKQGHVSPEQADKLTASRNASPSRLLLDAEGKVGRLYGAKTTPHMYIIDKKGTLRYMGAIDSIRSSNVEDIPKAVNYVDNGMQELLAGKGISEPVTRAYGCSVKY